MNSDAVNAVCVNVSDGSWNGTADHVGGMGGEMLGASQQFSHLRN